MIVIKFDLEIDQLSEPPLTVAPNLEIFVTRNFIPSQKWLIDITIFPGSLQVEGDI